MSTMDKEMMKNLLRIFQKGLLYLNDTKPSLLEYGKTILDKDKQKELEQLLTQLGELLENVNKKKEPNKTATNIIEDTHDLNNDRDDEIDKTRREQEKDLNNMRELNDTFLVRG
jgi:hypothetical protein